MVDQQLKSTVHGHVLTRHGKCVCLGVYVCVGVCLCVGSHWLACVRLRSSPRVGSDGQYIRMLQEASLQAAGAPRPNHIFSVARAVTLLDQKLRRQTHDNDVHSIDRNK